MKENNIEEDIKILKNMNDGYTFKDCDICNNYNEKTKHCDKHKCMELQAIEHILLDYKRVLKENEDFRNFLKKIIIEYIPDYELEQLIDRYKNERFIPRVEVKKILEDRRK